MAYDGSKLSLVTQLIAGGRKRWWYEGTDAVSAVRVAGYIADATARGMKAGDIVEYLKTDANPLAIQIFAVSAVSPAGAADLSDGLAITATNTD
jgi:hypothetical protein